MAEYPQRPPKGIWSNLVVRMMNKSCAANEIGPEGFTLVATIAMTEDAKRYSGAVTFYNAQLMPMTGLSSESRLASARTKAIDTGWLHYERGTKGVPGRYWTLIPEHACGFSDAPVDDGNRFPSECPSDFEGKTMNKRKENGGHPEGKPRTYKPNPQPFPSPLEGGDWFVVQKELQDCGVTAAPKAVQLARSHHWTVEHALVVLKVFRDKPNAWTGYELYQRFQLPASEPPKSGWPPESATYRDAQKADAAARQQSSEEARRKTHKAKVDAEERQRDGPIPSLAQSFSQKLQPTSKTA
jgi:hypothetical protein